MLIDLINHSVGRKNKLSCISRPRRFGKTWNAKMLTAYYDCSCDSHVLFDDKQIAGTEDYEKYLNQYNVICLDVSCFTSDIRKRQGSFLELPGMIEKTLWNDLLKAGYVPEENHILKDFLLSCVCKKGGKPFIFIIDEWDAGIREAKGDPAAHEAYLNLLRGWFKDSTFTPRAVAAAYMTGILPIKKDGIQSAISEFDEYSVLEPAEFAGFFGFTEDEVKELCRKRTVGFAENKTWYDGYDFEPIGSVYNPYSVMRALRSGKCKAYWRKTSAAGFLADIVNRDMVLRRVLRD